MLRVIIACSVLVAFALSLNVNRAADTCKVDADCNGTTCHHGAPHCEVHDPNAEHGHCNCHAPVKRAGEPCVTNDDCALITCNHGNPHCEIHDPALEHGHCNCHGKRAIHEGSHCTQKSDCAGLTCAANGQDYACVNNKCQCLDHAGGK